MLNFSLYAEYDTPFDTQGVELDVTLSNQKGYVEAQVHNCNSILTGSDNMSVSELEHLSEAINDDRVTYVQVGTVWSDLDDVNTVINYMQDLDFYKENPEKLPSPEEIEDALCDYFSNIEADYCNSELFNQIVEGYDPEVMGAEIAYGYFIE